MENRAFSTRFSSIETNILEEKVNNFKNFQISLPKWCSESVPDFYSSWEKMISLNPLPSPCLFSSKHETLSSWEMLLCLMQAYFTLGNLLHVCYPCQYLSDLKMCTKNKRFSSSSLIPLFSYHEISNLLDLNHIFPLLFSAFFSWLSILSIWGELKVRLFRKRMHSGG